MKKCKVLLVLLILVFSAALTCPGCSKGSEEAKARVDEAVDLIASSRPLMEDLINLNDRFNTLGARYVDVDDTIAEGKSLVEMALLDVEELESRYNEARSLLIEANGLEGAGYYSEYAGLAITAVDNTLAALELNRDLLNTVSDLLDVLPHAETEEQLSYYVEEIERLNDEIASKLDGAAGAAEAADLFYQEHGL